VDPACQPEANLISRQESQPGKILSVHDRKAVCEIYHWFFLQICIEKSDVGFDLELIEQAGLMALQESQGMDAATSAMHSLTLNGDRKASFHEDVLPYKSGATKAASDSESSETKSSGESGDSYSIKEDSDLDDSELFKFAGGDEAK
jgi:hypothetical protein